jgi:hypothetical protein
MKSCWGAIVTSLLAVALGGPSGCSPNYAPAPGGGSGDGGGACPGSQVSCSGGCVDTASDSRNCGQCGTVCSTGEVCVSGSCSCPDATTHFCPGAGCVDLRSDKANCGSCAKTCQDPTNGSASCASGKCVVSCNNGYVTLGATSNYCCPNKPFGKGVCDVLPECGCDPNENCARLSGAPESCVADGSVQQDGNCITTNTTKDCAQGLVCADLVCDVACLGTCSATNYECLLQLYTPGYADGSFAAAGGTYLGYGACKAHCNPADTAGVDSTHAPCGAGQRCDYLGDQTPPGRTYCLYSMGTGTAGVGCNANYNEDCAPDYVCVGFTGADGGADDHCRHYLS